MRSSFHAGICKPAPFEFRARSSRIKSRIENPSQQTSDRDLERIFAKEMRPPTLGQ